VKRIAGELDATARERFLGRDVLEACQFG